MSGQKVVYPSVLRYVQIVTVPDTSPPYRVAVVTEVTQLSPGTFTIPVIYLETVGDDGRPTGIVIEKNCT